MEFILISMVLFQIKHWLADFVFQTSDQVRYKGDYFHPAGLAHAGFHAVGSIPALLVLTRSPLIIGATMLFEFVLHYHTDWTKSQVDRKLRLNNTNSLYWTIFGADQLVHQLTYTGIIYAVVKLA